MSSTKSYDLEERLIHYAVSNLLLAAGLPNQPGAQNLAQQLGKSATSAALNYGEAQSAESDKDFIHKMKICIKEIRESQITLKILRAIGSGTPDKIDKALDESDQLISIFYTSIRTKLRNMASAKKHG